MNSSQLALFFLGFTVGMHGASSPAVYNIGTIAGSGSWGDGGPATHAELGNIQGVAVDLAGNLYLSDTDHNRVCKVDRNGVISIIAGTGVAGFAGDGGPAAAAALNLPYGLAADPAGDLYIADLGNQRVRRVNPDGTITTVAGTGVKGSAGDGGPATAAELASPRNVAVDGLGNVYIAEFEGQRVRRISIADGSIATVAGTGVAGFGGDGGEATAAQLAYPAGLAFDPSGALYIADSQNQRIRKLSPGGAIATVLGGSSATTLLTPTSVAVDSLFTIYTADASASIHAYTASGKWTRLAGTGVPGFAGDGGPAPLAQLTAPRDLALDAAGDLFIADGVRVRRVSSGVMQTVAGDGFLSAIGDGGPASGAILNQPTAVALDAEGNLYIADAGTARVRRATPAGGMETFAGTGVAGYVTDDVPAATAELNAPAGVAFGSAGYVYIADTGNQRVRVVGLDGLIQAYAGPDNATGIPLSGPRGICVSSAGAVYIADTGNHRVLMVNQSGIVSIAAGTGAAGYAGDGGPGAQALLNQPGACALNSAGTLFIADTGNHAIRAVTTDGVIHTVAGTGSVGFAGDEGPATAALLYVPAGIVVDDNGDIYIADSGNNRIRQVTPDGFIHTIAGSAAAGFAGDGAAALAAELNQPAGLCLDGSGNLYFADTGNNRVRRLQPQAVTVVPVQAQIPPVAVVNAASLTAGAVAPGEVVSLFGAGLGPPTGLAASLDSNGLMPTLLGGTQVLFDGVAAPLFYAQAGQLNAQVPYSVASESQTIVTVTYQSQVVGAATLAVAAAAPALFAVAVNQDGGINDSAAPAAAGSIVTLYATGDGITNGSNVTGMPATPPYAQPVLPVAVTVAGQNAHLIFAASAPGLVGLMQIDLMVPAGLSSGAASLVFSVGSYVAPPLTLWLQ